MSTHLHSNRIELRAACCAIAPVGEARPFAWQGSDYPTGAHQP